MSFVNFMGRRRILISVFASSSSAAPCCVVRQSFVITVTAETVNQIIRYPVLVINNLDEGLEWVLALLVESSLSHVSPI